MKKEKVLMERKTFIAKILGDYARERGKPFIFNYATIQEFGLLLLEKNFTSVGKELDKLELRKRTIPQSGKGERNKWFIDYKDIEKLKQKLGIQ